MLNEKERTQPVMQLESELQAFRPAVDDEEDDVIGKPLSVTLGCKPIGKKERECERGKRWMKGKGTGQEKGRQA